MKTVIVFSLTITLAVMPPVCIAEEWWSEGSPITTGLVGMSAEALDGKIYMFGGMIPPVPYYVTTVEVYDPKADLWSLGTPMPEDRMNVSLATVGDSIYVFGGIGGGYIKSTVWKYTPSLEGTLEGPWQAKNPIGYPVSSGTEICAGRGVTVCGGKVYIFGGYYATHVVPYVYANWQPYSTIWCYDPVNDTWEPKTNLPVAGYYHATTHGEKIYLLRDDPGANIFWEYDPSTDTLITTGLPPFAGGDSIYGASATTIGDIIYIVGGYNYPSTQATTWKYSLASPEQGWIQLADMPHPANSSAKATYQGNLYLFGGYSTSNGGASPIDFTQILHVTTPIPEPAPCDWKIVYQTDFSSDPGWTTDQPQNFYWETASGTYFIHQTLYPEAYEPDRYTFVKVPYSGGPFRMEWDLEMLRCDWSAGLNFGMYDSNLSYKPGPIAGTAALNVEYVDAGAGRGFKMKGHQDTTLASISNLTSFDLNVWYHNIFEYDPSTATAKWKVYRMGEPLPFMEETLTDIPTITNDISYLGASRYPVLHPWSGGVNPNAVAEARIDNVVLYAGCEPCALPVIDAIVDVAPDVVECEVELGKELEEPEDKFLMCFIDLADEVSCVDIDVNTVSLSVNETILANAEYPVILDNVLEVLFRLDLANMGHILGLEVAELEADDEKIEIKANSAPPRSIDLIELTVSGELMEGGRFVGNDAIRLIMGLDD